MTPQVHIPNATSRGVIASLRPPCAQNVTLRSGYSAHNPRQLGQVLVLPSLTEPITAPASGTVLSITRKGQGDWNHSAGDLDTHKTLEVRIDHGGYVSTVIHGLSTLNILVGQYVTRGDVLGYGKTTEFFCQLFYRNSPLDAATYSVFFRGLDGGKVTDKTRKLRSGPDFVSRALDRTMSILIGGIRYFVDKYASKPELLINIDFNGDGSKIGPAKNGITATDFWNVYEPVVFDTTSGYLCYAVLKPATELVSDVIDSGTSSTTFLSGGTFQVIFTDSGTDGASTTMTWLFGSTETIPEVDDVSVGFAYWNGTVTDIAVYTNGSDSGTVSFSWESGSLF